MYISQEMKSNREEMTNLVWQLNHTLTTTINEMSRSQQNLMKNLSDTLMSLTEKTEERFSKMRDTIEFKLKEIQDENSNRLEQMRQTVDEKLHSTLNMRLTESFKLVSERLEQVHSGLGQIQSLVNGVSDLKKVLSNIKTRGILGEIQLEAIIQDILAPNQYDKNVRVNPQSSETVEFAIKIPVESDSNRNYTWLPVDAKFPMEDFERIVEAEETADSAGRERLRKELENRLKQSARDIKDKYICPPYTTEFALMFLPTESLYAEALRKPGFIQDIHREHKVLITGPTTLSAVLNIFRLGLKIFTIEKKAEEVWNLLSAVKAEVKKFSELLEKVSKKLQETQNVIGNAMKKTGILERKLQNVEEMPIEKAEEFLSISSSFEDNTLKP